MSFESHDPNSTLSETGERQRPLGEPVLIYLGSPEKSFADAGRVLPLDQVRLVRSCQRAVMWLQFCQQGLLTNQRVLMLVKQTVCLACARLLAQTRRRSLLLASPHQQQRQCWHSLRLLRHSPARRHTCKLVEVQDHHSAASDAAVTDQAASTRCIC